MRERAIRFGPQALLVGVITEPPTIDADRPAVVFLNSGILHHVGASRLHVRMARRLAAAGFVALRFDFAGVGDSEASRHAVGPVEAALRDGHDALDHMQSAHGMHRFVLAGLCSGSDMAFHIGLADDRVVGIANIDAWAYRTLGYHVRRFVPKLLSPRAWRHSIRVRLRTGGAEPSDASGAFVAPEYRRVFPARTEVAAGLQQLLDRDVRMFHFFSAGMEERLNHASQYRTAFRSIDFGDRLEVIYRPEADHTVTQLEQQQFVAERMTGWVIDGWGSADDAAGDESLEGMTSGSPGH